MDSINNRVVPALSLERADGRWSSTLLDSALCRPLFFLYNKLTAALSRLANIGTSFQGLGVLILLAMCLVLAAPQFANDKNGLAFLVAAGFGLRFLGALCNGKEQFKPNAMDAIVLLFFASNVVSSFASHYLRDSLYGLAKLFVYILAYFWFVSCFQYRSQRRIVVALAALIAGALVVSLYGLYQYKMGVAPLATWEDPTIEDKAVRVFSTLGNPNLLAGYLIPIVPLSFALAAMSLCAKGMSRLFSLPLFGACGIITVATILTGSRGAYIALICVLALLGVVACEWIWLKLPKGRIPLLIALVVLPIAAVLAVHFAAPQIEHRFMSIFAGAEHSSNAYRLNVWKASLEMFKDNWWLGIGTGNKTFCMAYGLYMRSGFDALGTYCVPLEIAVETGVPGLLIFGWLLLTCMARAHSRFWSATDPMTRWIALGAFTAIVGMMAHGLVDTVFLRPQVQFIFWLAIAMLVALPSTATETPTN